MEAVQTIVHPLAVPGVILLVMVDAVVVVKEVAREIVLLAVKISPQIVEADVWDAKAIVGRVAPAAARANVAEAVGGTPTSLIR